MFWDFIIEKYLRKSKRQEKQNKRKYNADIQKNLKELPRIKQEVSDKYILRAEIEVNQDIKNCLDKFPVETIEAFEYCGYEITELLTKKQTGQAAFERLAQITKEFSFEELKSVSSDTDKIYGMGIFIAGGHEEAGIKSSEYLKLLKKMIA